MSRSTSMFSTGLAAGALLFVTGFVTQALSEAGVSYEVIGVIPVPMRVPDWGSRGSSWLLVMVCLVVVVGTVALLSSLARGSGGARRGGAALFMSSWFSCLLGGALAGLVSGAVDLVRFSDSPAGEARYVIASSLSVGLLWGLLFGWLVALVALAVARRGTPDGEVSSTGVPAYPSVPEYPSTADSSEQR